MEKNIMAEVNRIVNGLIRRLKWIIKGCPKQQDLLEMVWPQSLLASAPQVSVPKGYSMRQYNEVDRCNYLKLLASANMDTVSLKYWEQHILEDGFFVIECDQTKVLVAACFASHHPSKRHKRGGNFGWLAADPAHKGRKLGQAVSAAVTARLVDAGYKQIYLETHDFRLAAIKIYLVMGWVPFLYTEEMLWRWEGICEAIDYPYTPELWSVK
jgi:mycothiol synthase